MFGHTVRSVLVAVLALLLAVAGAVPAAAAPAAAPPYELVAGDPIFGPGGTRCYIGFVARSGTTAYVVTAGSCTASGGTWSGSNGVAIGPVSASAFPGDDFGLITVTNTAWVPMGKVRGGAGPITGATAAAVGASVCRPSSVSGLRCGTIQAKNATINYGGGTVVYGLTRTTVCSDVVERGMPFLSGTQLQGIAVGGSGTCSSGGTTYFQPAAEILSRYRLTVVTG